MSAYTIKELVPGVRSAEKTNGTGSGILYVLPLLSNDTTIDIRFIVAEAAPSTTDTFNVGSLWIDITTGSVKMYIKTAATTWTVAGAQTA